MSFSQREEPRAYTCNKTMQRTGEPKDYSPSWNWDKCKYIFHFTLLRPVTDLALLPWRPIQSTFSFPDLLNLLWSRLVRQKLKIPPSFSSPFIWWKECLPLYSSCTNKMIGIKLLRDLPGKNSFPSVFLPRILMETIKWAHNNLPNCINGTSIWWK